MVFWCCITNEMAGSFFRSYAYKNLHKILQQAFVLEIYKLQMIVLLKIRGSDISLPPII